MPQSFYLATICEGPFRKILEGPFAFYCAYQDCLSYAENLERTMALQRSLLRQSVRPFQVIGLKNDGFVRGLLVPEESSFCISEVFRACSRNELADGFPEIRFLGVEQYLGNFGRQAASISGIRLPLRNEPFFTIRRSLLN